jgi:hypothetical protein
MSGTMDGHVYRHGTPRLSVSDIVVPKTLLCFIVLVLVACCVAR